MNSNARTQAFLQLQEKYLLNFPEKLERIEECLNNQDLNGLGNHFHKLKGSGQTYGFKPITDIALPVHLHYKLQSPDFLKWAKVGFTLLQKIQPLLHEKNSTALDDFPEFQQLVNSIKPPIEKGKQ